MTEAVEALRAAGWPRRRSRRPAALLRDPHLLARGFWETVDHPVVGSFLCTGMPFAFVGKPRRWIRRVPPLYGQHTGEILTGVLGRSEQDLAALRSRGPSARGRRACDMAGHPLCPAPRRRVLRTGPLSGPQGLAW